MRTHFRFVVTAGLVLAAFSSPALANQDSGSTTDGVDEAWAERALANPERDQGWTQPCHNESDRRVTHCEVREFPYSRSKRPVAIDGGDNGGMTVMGWDRDEVRMIYRVTTRARTEDRARALAEEVQLELAKGVVRPSGPETTANESWNIEIKAWVPRASDLALSTHNGPLGLRDVHGRMDLNSINGPVSLVDLGGAVQARVQNGPLHVALAGSRWLGTGLDAEAENGPLNLVLPADYSARLVTGTINGPWAFDYAIKANPRNAWIFTTLGKGGPPVRVVTTNGPFRIAER